MPDEYRKIECPNCKNTVFVPVSTPMDVGVNNVHVEYRIATCPSCLVPLSIIDRSFIEMSKGIVQRYETDNMYDIAKDINEKYMNTISVIDKDITEKLLDDKKKEKMFRVSLIAPGDEELNTKEEVYDYIRNNYDQDDLEEWINENFDRVEIGPYSWSPAEIIDGMGESYSEIAEYESYDGNYAIDCYDNSDVVDIDEEFTKDDVPEDGSMIKIGGMMFRYKVKEAE